MERLFVIRVRRWDEEFIAHIVGRGPVSVGKDHILIENPILWGCVGSYFTEKNGTQVKVALRPEDKFSTEVVTIDTPRPDTDRVERESQRLIALHTELEFRLKDTELELERVKAAAVPGRRETKLEEALRATWFFLRHTETCLKDKCIQCHALSSRAERLADEALKPL